MEKEIYETWNNILIKTIIMSLICCLFSCVSKESSESVELTDTRFSLEVPSLFFRGAPLKKEKLSTIYNIRIIDKNYSSIDFNDFIYEKDGNIFKRLNPINLKNSFDSLSHNDTINIHYMSNTSIYVMFHPDSLKIYEKKGIELAESHRLFCKYKGNYKNVPLGKTHNYSLYTFDKNGKWYFPLEVDVEGIFK